MNKTDLYDDYPIRIVLLRVTIACAFLISASVVMSFWGMAFLAGFIVLASAVFVWIMANVCTSCVYHGRRCDLALGLLVGILFKQQRDDRRFNRMGKRSFLLLYVLAGIPLLAGAAEMIVDFKVQILIWTSIYVILTAVFFLSTPLVSCPHCKMQDWCVFCWSFQRKTERKQKESDST